MASTFFSAFNGSTIQLYKLGADQSVTQWTAIDNLFPFDPTEFDGNAWFAGDTGGAEGRQLYKLGFDASVTKWTAIMTPGGGGLFPAPGIEDLTVFNNALWFDGFTPNQGFQLYKLGNDGSVTKWTAIPGINPNPTLNGLLPNQLTDFNNAL